VKLSEFIAPSRVLIPLDCETLDRARTALLERLVASGAIEIRASTQVLTASEPFWPVPSVCTVIGSCSEPRFSVLEA